MGKLSRSRGSATKVTAGYEGLLSGVVDLLHSARRAAARNVNSIMTAVYWEMGRRIVEVEQRGTDRASYGESLLARLSQDLTKRFGRGFGVVNLSQMRKFTMLWPASRIFQTVSEESETEPVVRELFVQSTQEFTHADAGQMHLYLNYAREHWTHSGENPPVGLILCASKDSAVAKYSLEGLPNKVVATEYRLALPDPQSLADELAQTRRQLESRKGN